MQTYQIQYHMEGYDWVILYEDYKEIFRVSTLEISKYAKTHPYTGNIIRIANEMYEIERDAW